MLLYRQSLYSEVNVRRMLQGFICLCVTGSDTLNVPSCITLNSAGLHTFAAASPQCSVVGCVVNLHKYSLIRLWDYGNGPNLFTWLLLLQEDQPCSLNHSRHPPSIVPVKAWRKSGCVLPVVLTLFSFQWEEKEWGFSVIQLWFLQILARKVCLVTLKFACLYEFCYHIQVLFCFWLIFT